MDKKSKHISVSPFIEYDQKISLVTNLLPIRKMPSNVYKYNVIFTPPLHKNIICKHFKRIYNDSKDSIFTDCEVVFDGISTIITNKKLDEEYYQIKYGQDPRQIKIVLEIKYINTFSLSDICTQNKNGIDLNSQNQCLDIISRSFQHENFLSESNKSFLQNMSISLNNYIDLHFGISQSIKIINSAVFKNINLSFILTYKSLNLLQLFNEFINASMKIKNINEINIAYIKKEIQIKGPAYIFFKQIIKHMKLSTNYISNKTISFKAIGVTEAPANKLFFEFENRKTTVEEYFKIKYKTLNYPDLPCIERKNKFGQIIHYPLECLNIAPYQKIKKKLNEQDTAEVIKIMAKTPNERFDMLQQIGRKMEINKNSSMNNFNLEFKNHFLECKGILLNPPEIEYGLNYGNYVKPEKGSWATRNCLAIHGVTINKLIICFLNDTNMTFKEINNSINGLIRYAERFGMNINPDFSIKPVKTPSEYLNIMEVHKPELIIFILPAHQKNNVYQHVKTYSETEGNKYITQCVQHKNLRKFGDPSFVFNLLLKINAKMNGKNWKLSASHLALFNVKPTIIFGAYLSHPKRENLNEPSIASVTASMDLTLNKFNVEISYQEKKITYIEELTKIIRTMLMMYYLKNKQKPERIIFFRDGLNELEMEVICKKEVELIRESCKYLEDGYNPEITYISLQKNHQIRFKLKEDTTDPRNTKVTGNVPPGVVIEELSNSEFFEFYMISQNAFQGTAHPILYRVLKNGSDFKKDDLYRMINNLCYTYTKCAKAVTLISPIKYAHLASDRAIKYLKCQENIRPKLTEELKDRMFYL